MSNLLTNRALEEEVSLQVVYVKKDKPKHNYEQIDTIRFINIFFIVWGHCLLGWDSRFFNSVTDDLITTIVLQTGRLSTVVFFIVSGFLLKPKLETYTVSSYFKERIPKIYSPWFIFITIFLILNIIHLLPFRSLWQNRDLPQFIRLNYNILNGVMLHSAYWFITTYMVGMAIIVAFKKYVKTFWFGGVLFFVTIFYCFNLHYQWIDPNHQKAVLAYTFFIWLGIKVNTHYTRILEITKKVSWLIIIALFLLTFAVAGFEGYNLTVLKSGDAFASNRLSNVVLSVVFFILLLKIGKISSINNLNPRRTVYGIYLVHAIVILELMIFLNSGYMEYISGYNIWNLLLLQIGFALFIFWLTYKIVKIIGNSRLCWTIGCRRA
ncbi:MAG: acyltransferase [Sphingobacteriaceae bacterium]|nr:acyltransferase [Sphingobacteriaceae bacterium]